MRRSCAFSTVASGENVCVSRHSSWTDVAALISVASFGAVVAAIAATHLRETVSFEATPSSTVGMFSPPWTPRRQPRGGG